jgi:hypothetical protein
MCSNRVRLTAILLVLLAALLPKDADARGLGRALRVARVAAGAARVYGRIETGEHVMTVSELSVCIRTIRQADAGDATLAAERAALDSEAKRLERLAAEIERDGPRVDRYDQASVDKFNGRVTTFERAATALEARGAKFDASVTAHNLVVSSYNANCYGRSYYEDDYSKAERLSY